MAAAVRSVLSLRGVQRISLPSHCPCRAHPRSRASLQSLTPPPAPLGLNLTSDFVPVTSFKATRALKRHVRRNSSRTSGSPGTKAAADVEQLKGARKEIKEIIQSKYCNPILIRLGWHDAGTFDKSVKDWPVHGGANGSIRFVPEKGHAANAGLDNGIGLLDPVKEKFPGVSYADLFQLASATAIEMAGGPEIDMKYGRVDADGPSACPKEGNLPSADPPSPADHLREVFYRMGLNDKDIVALSGAHTLGRSRPDRSGFGKPETKYTKDGPGKGGGQSWTVEWLKFDNSYFKDIIEKRDEDLLVLPTDNVLTQDPSFKEFTELYAKDQAAFFKDYAESHKKLSELGSKFDPPEGVKIGEGPVAEKFSAAKYSSGEA